MKYIQSIVLCKKGSEKPNGNLPLICRITVDDEIKQFNCKMDIPLRLCDVKNNRASGKSAKVQRINCAVDKIRVGYIIVLKHIVTIARNEGCLTFNPFARYINFLESMSVGTQQYIFSAAQKDFSHPKSLSVHADDLVSKVGILSCKSKQSP